MWIHFPSPSLHSCCWSDLGTRSHPQNLAYNTHTHTHSIRSPFCIGAVTEHSANYIVGRAGKCQCHLQNFILQNSSIWLVAGVIFSPCRQHACIDLSFILEETVCTVSTHGSSFCCTSTVTSEKAKLASAGSECRDMWQSGAFKVNKRGQWITVQHLALFLDCSRLTCPLNTLAIYFINKWFLNMQSDLCLFYWDNKIRCSASVIKWRSMSTANGQWEQLKAHLLVVLFLWTDHITKSFLYRIFKSSLDYLHIFHKQLVLNDCWISYWQVFMTQYRVKWLDKMDYLCKVCSSELRIWQKTFCFDVFQVWKKQARKSQQRGKWRERDVIILWRQCCSKRSIIQVLWS